MRGYTEKSNDVAWEEWKHNFNKEYSSDEEEEERRIVWERRIEEINEFNERNESFKQTVNQFADIVSTKYWIYIYSEFTYPGFVLTDYCREEFGKFRIFLT